VTIANREPGFPTIETIPSLRLAGATESPARRRVEALIALRSQLIVAARETERDADLVRSRLESGGRRDAIAHVTGVDVFDRARAVIDEQLALIDQELSQAGEAADSSQSSRSLSMLASSPASFFSA